MRSRTPAIATLTALLFALSCVHAADSQITTEILPYAGRSEVQFENLTFDTNGQTFSFAGKIKNCEYIGKRTSSRSKYYRDQFGQTQSYPDGERSEAQRVSFVPHEICPISPYTPAGDTVKISSSGEFSVSGTLRSRYYFAPPSRVPRFFSVYRLAENAWIKLTVYPEHAARYFLSSDETPKAEHVVPLTLYYLDLTEKLADTVTIKALDKDTHSPVEATLTVTAISVTSKDDIGNQLKEQCSNELLKKALDSVPAEFLREGSKTTAAETLSFVAIKGGVYKIESVHPGYYYFTKSFRVDSAKDLSKAVLLVEKPTSTQSATTRQSGELVNSQ